MKAFSILALAALLAASGLTACSQRSAASPEKAKIAHVASAHRAPFHRSACRWAARISSLNLQTFETRHQAVNTGHRP